ncbi:MAG: alcohol dehydrogenase catalytic domain-containing protein [Vicinamibacteria bacterium]|nr:alcohol dehydrogenase catalytic domain-containing protein [Vicinamibacteria bacterium]
MKAAVLYGPGDVRVEDLEDPIPGPGEIVVQTLAALTCGTDRKVVTRGYHDKMLQPPCVFGHEGAGRVAAVGEGVTSFRIGDGVVAANSAPCGQCRACLRGRHSLCKDLLFWNGVFAEAYLVPARVVEKNVLRLGEVAPQDAAMTEPLACCLKGVLDAGVGEGDRVLVIGAGAIGLLLIRLCQLKGAHVAAAARRPEALHMATAHGANEAAQILFAEPGLTLSGTADPLFDVVFDAGGAAQTASLAVRSAARGGTVSLFAGCPSGTKVEIDVTRVHYDEIRILGSFHHDPAAFREAFRLIETKSIVPADFVSARKTLAELPDSLINPEVGSLKTLVVF